MTELLKIELQLFFFVFGPKTLLHWELFERNVTQERIFQWPSFVQSWKKQIL